MKRRTFVLVLVTTALACGDDGAGGAGGASASASGTSSGAATTSAAGDPAGSTSTSGGGGGGDGGGATTSASAGGAGGSTGPGGAGGGPSTGPGGGGAGSALRFFGHGAGDVDRLKIPVDVPPPDDGPGPPVDVGAEDFTIELWLRASAADNPAPAVACGANLAWIEGNILVDRDRYNQDRKFGVSIAGGRIVFGVSGDGTGDRTICGRAPVLDDAWHHVAVARRRSDGHLWIFVDGALDAEGDGPDGDVSYPDDGVPGDFCQGPCDFSDPFLVIAAEKHDAGPAYPSFSGLVDELRISRVLRYAAPFERPRAPFEADGDTVGLYHLDEGQGTIAGDSSGAPGGPTDGELRVGGDPPGPLWVSDSPFGG